MLAGEMLESIHGALGVVKFQEEMEEKGKTSKLYFPESRYSAITFR